MPINKPYAERSIVDDALAFTSKGRSSTSGVVLYQSELATNVTNTTTIVRADEAALEALRNAAMQSVVDSEQRSKHWVDDYKRVFQWDISADVEISTLAFDPVQFNSEVVRSVGCRFNGATGVATSYWEYVCPSDAEGLYWIYAHVMYKLLVSMFVTKATLSVSINGVQFRTIDSIDPGYAGEAPIVDCKLAGGCHVPLKAGDSLTITVYLFNGVAGDVTLLYPTSVYGFVTGHRERCDMDDVDGYRNGAAITAPTSGNSFNFT